MARWISCICLPAILFFAQACTKDADKSTSGRDLLGIWVDIDHPADSLLITKGNFDLLLFDNSMAYRANEDPVEARQYFSSYIRLKLTGIEAARYQPGFARPDYLPYAFQWEQIGARFTISAVAFRPYLSCSGCMLTYVKVK
jgi:hypothetical protein